MPDLHTLINPRAVAVIGASANPKRAGNIVFNRLLSQGRPIYPVHPKERQIEGVPVYNDIKSLPEGVDVAVITVAAASAVDAARECAAKGIPFAIVIAGGFSEIGGEGTALEEELKEIAASSATRILGPNSLGVFVPEHRLDTIFVEHGDRALSAGGGVAFITQSGSVGVEALGLASNTGFGLRAFVGIGNKADLDELDFLELFGQDDGTSCIALYLESIERGRPFLYAAKAIAKEKPVVVLKAGRTLAGAKAASSHTGRLAGDDTVLKGVLTQHFIHRADDDEELCDAAKTLSLLEPVRGGRVAILTPAGGYGVMCADFVLSTDNSGFLDMAELSEETKTLIRQASFPYASCDNPVDVSASADNEVVANCLEAMLKDDGVDIIVYIAFFAPPGITREIIPRIAQLSALYQKPILAFTQYGPFTDSHIEQMYLHGIVGFPSLARTVRAARFLVERTRFVHLAKEDSGE